MCLTFVVKIIILNLTLNEMQCANSYQLTKKLNELNDFAPLC